MEWLQIAEGMNWVVLCCTVIDLQQFQTSGDFDDYDGDNAGDYHGGDYHHQIISSYHDIIISRYSIKILELKTTSDVFFFHAQVRNVNCYSVTHECKEVIQDIERVYNCKKH